MVQVSHLTDPDAAAVWPSRVTPTHFVLCSHKDQPASARRQKQGTLC